MKRIVFLIALAAAIPTGAFARGGELSSITLGFQDGTPPEARAKVQEFLSQNFTFAGGTYVNTAVSHRFAGSMAKLSELIELLHASEFAVQLRFADLQDDRATFLLAQNMAAPGEATITINVTKEGFRWSELKLQIPRAVRDVEPAGPANRSEPARERTPAPGAGGSAR